MVVSVAVCFAVLSKFRDRGLFFFIIFSFFLKFSGAGNEGCLRDAENASNLVGRNFFLNCGRIPQPPEMLEVSFEIQDENADASQPAALGSLRFPPLPVSCANAARSMP